VFDGKIVFYGEGRHVAAGGRGITGWGLNGGGSGSIAYRVSRGDSPPRTDDVVHVVLYI
jgi:hypothetical protein